MRHVFVYGSLMFHAVWRRLIKTGYRCSEATLNDYKRLCVKGAAYPGLIKSRGNEVRGRVYFNVRPRDLRTLDRFEGDDYRRMTVCVHREDGTSLNADTYVFRNRRRTRLSAREWNAEDFRADSMRAYLR